jgi:predicted ArsR family transcriptional regulator
MLLSLAEEAGIDGEMAVGAGKEEGQRLAHRRSGTRPCAEAAVVMLDELGFDPARVDEGAVATIAFTHCPFADLAESDPDLVCSLHRGMLEGFVDEVGGAAVLSFNDLADREPCRAQLGPTA